jgi:hypothetical protein
MGQDCCAAVRACWLVDVYINSFATDIERERLGTYFCKRLSCENWAVNEHNKKRYKPNFCFSHAGYSPSAGPYNGFHIGVRDEWKTSIIKPGITALWLFM